MKNRDNNLIDDFGEEWNKFDQLKIDQSINEEIFNKYFKIFPWSLINNESVGMDVGAGSGRWSYFMAEKVQKLYLIEPSSKAINVSKKNLSRYFNIEYINTDANDIPLQDDTIDFCYCLGVLHHIPNIKKALNGINKKLKVNAPLLIYIYYSFENKPLWFRIIWRLTDIFRIIISRMPFFIKSKICDLIAFLVYFPLSRISKIFRNFGFNVKNFPLSFYSNKSIYVLRNDALDRFGTKIEQRLSKQQITDLLKQTGFNNISFSDEEPYWCAISYKEKNI